MSVAVAVNTAAVRAAIGTNIDADTLPDTIIVMDIYRGTAIRWLMALDPALETNWAIDANKNRIGAALILKTASLLVIALPWILSEQWKEQGFTRQPVNTEILARELAARAQTEANNYLLEVGVITTGPSAGILHFTLARGTRGQ